MRVKRKTRAQLVRELEALRMRLGVLDEHIPGGQHVERAQSERERMLSQLVETASDWIWEVDEDATYTFSSPRVEDILGYVPEEIIGRTPFDFMPVDEAKRMAEIFAAIRESKQPFTGLVNTNVHKDGRFVVLETCGIPILDEDGNLHGFWGIDRDVTALKRADEALRESDRVFRALSETGFEGVCIHEQGTVLACNQAFASILGFEPEELTGTDVSRFIKPEQFEKVKAYVQSGYEEPYEVELVRNDGSTFTAAVQATNITYQDRPVRVVIMQDFTDRKRQEVEIVRRSALVRGINRVLQEALTSRTDREVAKVCVEVAGEIMQSRMCFYGELNERGTFDTLAYSESSWEECSVQEDDICCPTQVSFTGI